MATHSSILAWKIPWAEEPGRLQSQRSLCQQLQVCSSNIGLVAQSCLTVQPHGACQAPLSMEFSRQEYFFLLQGIFPTKG